MQLLLENFGPRSAMEISLYQAILREQENTQNSPGKGGTFEGFEQELDISSNRTAIRKFYHLGKESRYEMRINDYDAIPRRIMLQKDVLVGA